MGGAEQLIAHVITDGTPAEKQFLFSFSIADEDRVILKKFKLFARSNFFRFFESDDAPFHDVTILNYIRSYKGAGEAENNGIEIAFRGASKTSLLKLFLVFVLLCDNDKYRKYIKVLSKDGKNSKQIVTDIYNMIVECEHTFGSQFDKDERKREETMSSFTTEGGRKLTSGTIGQTQRGHIQDAYRPDWIWFDDVEDSGTVASITITENIISKADEAIQGLAIKGNFIVTANYISDTGVVQWFLNKPNINSHIVPIVDLSGNPTWPERYTREKAEALMAGSEDPAGEYLCDPTRVGTKFFDIDRVEADLAARAKPPKKTSAGIRYFLDYQPHHRYGQGNDLSDGIGKDSCAMALFDFTTGELAATADDNLTAPDLFMYDSIRVGREFGNCIIAPEVNNSCGGIAVSTLKHEGYPNVYVKELRDRVGNVMSTKIGWETNSKTKPEMFYNFRKDYNDGLIIIYDERVLKEMKQFTKADLQDRATGAITRHFDLLTAVVIAWQMRALAQSAGDIKDFYNNLANRAPRGTRGAAR